MLNKGAATPYSDVSVTLRCLVIVCRSGGAICLRGTCGGTFACPVACMLGLCTRVHALLGVVFVPFCLGRFVLFQLGVSCSLSRSSCLLLPLPSLFFLRFILFIVLPCCLVPAYLTPCWFCYFLCYAVLCFVSFLSSSCCLPFLAWSVALSRFPPSLPVLVLLFLLLSFFVFFFFVFLFSFCFLASAMEAKRRERPTPRTPLTWRPDLFRVV